MPTVPAPFPIRGRDTGSGAQSQPALTSPDRLNARSFDVRDGRRARGARRAGVVKDNDTALAADCPVRALAAGSVTRRVGGTTVSGTPDLLDGFTESDTSYNDLGDRFNNTTGAAGSDSTDDYSIYVGSAGGISNTYVNAAYSSGRAPRIQSNAVVDTVSPDTGDHTAPYPMFAAVSRLPVPTGDVFALEIKATTASSLTGVVGGVGFILFADRTTLDIPTTDDSTLLVVERIGTGNVVMESNPYRNINSGSYRTLLEQFEDTAEVAMSWQASTTYTFRLVVSGNYGELYVKVGSGDFQFKQRWSNLRKWYNGTGTDSEIIENDNNDVGFLMFNVGNNGMFASIDDFAVYDATAPEADVQTVIGAACDQDVFIQDSDGDYAVAQDGSNVLSDNADTCAIVGPGAGADQSPAIYFLDGSAALRLDLETSVVTDWKAASTDFPAGRDATLLPRYGVRYNNRPVLFGIDDTPDRVVFGRKDDWEDFNLTPSNADIDGEQAVALNAEGPVRCVLPFTGQQAIIGLLDGMFLLTADPALGGSLLRMQGQTGIVGPFAWALDTVGAGYFVAPDGLYRVLPDGSVDPISRGREDAFFDAIDHENSIVRLAWNAEHDGLHCFVQPRAGEAVTDHMFWYRRNGVSTPNAPPGAFDPDRFGDPGIGPTAVAVVVNQSGSRGRVLMGGWDGYIRRFDGYADDDDGVAMASYADFPPLTGGGFRDVVLHELRVLTGPTSESMRVELRSAQDAAALDGSAARITRDLTGAGVRRPVAARVGGGAVGIRVGSVNGSYWSYEAGEVVGEGAELKRGRNT